MTVDLETTRLKPTEEQYERALHLINRYRLLVELENWHLTDSARYSGNIISSLNWRPIPKTQRELDRRLEEEERTDEGKVRRMLNSARREALKAAATVGWLDGLELRDECGELRAVVDRIEERPCLLGEDSIYQQRTVIYRDGSGAVLSDFLDHELDGTSCYLTLHGEAHTYGDAATARALKARADAWDAASVE